MNKFEDFNFTKLTSEVFKSIKTKQNTLNKQTSLDQLTREIILDYNKDHCKPNNTSLNKIQLLTHNGNTKHKSPNSSLYKINQLYNETLSHGKDSNIKSNRKQISQFLDSTRILAYNNRKHKNGIDAYNYNIKQLCNKDNNGNKYCNDNNSKCKMSAVQMKLIKMKNEFNCFPKEEKDVVQSKNNKNNKNKKVKLMKCASNGELNVLDRSINNNYNSIGLRTDLNNFKNELDVFLGNNSFIKHKNNNNNNNMNINENRKLTRTGSCFTLYKNDLSPIKQTKNYGCY